MNSFLERLQSERYLILDGAIGTLLFDMGLEQGAPPEEWNVIHPERIQELHRRYIEAGSDIVLTNSFGGTCYRLKLHNLQNQVYELNKAAAENGRVAAANASRPVLVAGSMGPTGELMEPLGTMTFDDAKAAFAEQANGLADGGVDMLWIETMSDLDEVRAAVAGAQSVSNLPVAATMSFDTNGRTMMGVTAERAIKVLGELNLAAIGANCGQNLPDTMAAIQVMHEINPDIPLISKANAGIPHWSSDGELVYDGVPEVMAGYAYHVHQQGAQLIGACCGSSPATIRAIRAALNGEIPIDQLVFPQKETEAELVVNESGETPRRKRRRRR